MPKEPKAPDLAPAEQEIERQAEEAGRRDTERYEGLDPQQSVGQALLDSSHRELKEAAATMKTLSGYFSQVFSAEKPAGHGDELDDELRDFMAGSFGYQAYQTKLRRAAELTGQLAALLDGYADFDTRVDSADKERAQRIETDAFIRIKSLLDECMENLDGCLIYKESESVMFRNLYSQIANTAILLEDMTDGHLIKPLNGQEADPDGKPIHRITVRDPELQIISEGAAQAERVERGSDQFELNMSRYYLSAEDVPLFAHEPNEEDIAQGYLGDCYMLATLGAIVKNDPARIKDAMKDNRDGTVTVRFFNQKNEPLYVTVQKTVPSLEYMHAPFSHGPLWVKMLEKAFAASGLSPMPGPFRRRNTAAYARIEGGYSELFFQYFLGQDLKTDSRSAGYHIEFSQTHGTDYSPEEQRNFDTLREAADQNRMITASTRRAADFQWIAHERGIDPMRGAMGAAPENIDAESYLGIFPSHVYTVTGTAEIEGLKYVILRNPHGSDGFLPDQNGNVRHVADAQGRTYLELRNYRMLFSDQVIAELPASPLDRLKVSEARRFQKDYRETLTDFARRLQATEHIFNWQFWDSDAFTELDASAKKLVAELNAEPPRMSALDRHFQEFLKNAQAYWDYRTAPAKDQKEADELAKKNARPRSQERMALTAEILTFAREYRQGRARAETLAEERRKAPGPTLETQIAQGYAIPEADPARRITMDVLTERIGQKRAELQKEEPFENGTPEQVRALAFSLRHLRFKELRRMLCEAHLEESTSVSTGLLQARAFLRAGHTAAELKKTELAADPIISPYFDLLEQVVKEDEAQYQNDVAFATAYLTKAFPQFARPIKPIRAAAEKKPARTGPVQTAVPAAQPDPPREGPTSVAQGAIDASLHNYNTDIELAARIRLWHENDAKFGLPVYRIPEERDRFAFAVHVKEADREARKKTSLRAAEALARVVAPQDSMRMITRTMVRRSGMEKPDVDRLIQFMYDHEKLCEAVLELQPAPAVARRNLQAVRVMADGTPQEKGELLRRRMAELTEAQSLLRIRPLPLSPNELIDQVEKADLVMRAVASMTAFLYTREGQHSGVSLDEISAFREKVRDASETYQAGFREFLYISDPIYPYIDVKAGKRYLEGKGNEFAAEIKRLTDEVKAKEAMPRTPERIQEIENLKAGRKAVVASVIGLVKSYREVGFANIRDSAKIEGRYTDYTLALFGKRAGADPAFQQMADNADPQKLFRVKDGNVTLDMQEAEKLEKLLAAQSKMDELNQKIKDEETAINERRQRAAQAQAAVQPGAPPQNAGPVPNPAPGRSGPQI